MYWISITVPILWLANIIHWSLMMFCFLNISFFLKLPQITINFWQKKLGVFYTCYTVFILRPSFTIICILSSPGDPISQVSSFLRKSLLEIRLWNIWVLENIFQVSLTLDWILGWVWNARLGNIFFLLASSIAFENYKVILITMLHLQLVFLSFRMISLSSMLWNVWKICLCMFLFSFTVLGPPLHH